MNVVLQGFMDKCKWHTSPLLHSTSQTQVSAWRQGELCCLIVGWPSKERHRVDEDIEISALVLLVLMKYSCKKITLFCATVYVVCVVNSYSRFRITWEKSLLCMGATTHTWNRINKRTEYWSRFYYAKKRRYDFFCLRKQKEKLIS